MKRTLTLILTLALAFAATAQQHERHGKKPAHQPDITKMVSDLSAKQKKQLEEITANSKAEADALRAQQKALRDSIDLLMQRDGDQSTLLFPLFDREAAIQAAISRNMYATRIRIDGVLTPDQRKEMKASLDKRQAERHLRHDRKPSPKELRPSPAPVTEPKKK